MTTSSKKLAYWLPNAEVRLSRLEEKLEAAQADAAALRAALEILSGTVR